MRVVRAHSPEARRVRASLPEDLEGPVDWQLSLETEIGRGARSEGRLDGARRELRTGRADTVIATVANRWGFWHMGKFAADDRRSFGELPSETLRRATARSCTPRCSARSRS